MTTRVAILGSTGSIGESALSVIEHLGDRIQVVGVAAGRSVQRLAEQSAVLGCRWASVADAEFLGPLRRELPEGCRALADPDELCAAVAGPDVDMVLCAVVGTAGLAPVLSAIRAGKDIALASKEILVMAGQLVMAEAVRCGVRILPVDSEHCALFQCLEGRSAGEVRRLILTASGGPFRALSAAELAEVTPEQALAHPTWSMGRKVTIDSATLMNKGLELIEARWLFDVAAERIDIVVHPQSVIHSMVEFTDGGLLAQMGVPDMRLPIQYCLTYPERCDGIVTRMDFGRPWELTFEPPDFGRFPAPQFAREALQAGGTMPAVLNAANEVAVEGFCNGVLRFSGIWQVVEQALSQHEVVSEPSLDEILAADGWARELAARVVSEC